MPHTGMHGMVRTVVPTGVIAMEVRVMPRVVPQMSIIVASPMMPPMKTMMICPRVAPCTPSEGIVHPIVPIVPVARSREYVGIHAVIVDIPVPAGPQRTAIHHIPVERTAHGDSIARIAETDDTHSILIVRVATVETADPTLVLDRTGEAQGIGIHPHRVALFGNGDNALSLYGIALPGTICSTAVIRILVHLELLGRGGSHSECFGFLFHLLRHHLHHLLFLGNEVQVITLCRCRTDDSYCHQGHQYYSFHTFILYLWCKDNANE